MASRDPLVVTVPAELSLESVGELRRAIASANASDSPVIVLRGRSDVFCRGLALGQPVAELRAGIGDFVACLADLRFSPKPVIALVEGEALGGGVGLVAACDVVVALPGSSFALPEVLVGLGPAIVWPLLLERMRPQAARLWALTAFRRTPAEALTAGLVDEIVDDAAHAAAIRRWAKVLGRGQGAGVRVVKQLEQERLRDALSQGAEITASALSALPADAIAAWGALS
jgi:enoyl-CoA hydratase/carnithine racemase